MSSEVPEGWHQTSLDEACAFIGRGSAPSYSETETGIWAVNQKCVRSGRMDLGYARPANISARVKAASWLRPSDVCINSTGTGTIGRISQFDGPEGTYFADSHVTIARPGSTVLGKFLAEYLQLPDVYAAIETTCFTGSTNQVELSRTALGELDILVPPLPEQKKIAAILTAVDGAIAATDALIAQTRRVKQGVLKHLLTRGIGHTRFKQTEIGEIPEGWEVSSLADAGVSVIDGDRGANYPKASDFSNQGYCLFLSAKNVPGCDFAFKEAIFIDKMTFDGLRKGAVREGDIVITTRGTLGNVALHRGDLPFNAIQINSGMALLRNNGTKLDTEYLYTLTRSPIIQDQVVAFGYGSAQPQLSLRIIERFIIAVPSIAEQQRIQTHAASLYEAEVSATTHLHQLNDMKSALMSDLLTGRKRVSLP